jgi:hypothetical protein
MRLWCTSFSATLPVGVSATLRQNFPTLGSQRTYLQAQSSFGTVIGDTTIRYPTLATNSATIYKFLAAATTNAASIKASAGRVVGWQFTNLTASPKFVRLFNKASAPTVGTDSPVIVIAVPANGAVNHAQEGGIGFATGIAFACTGAGADLDNTATAANDILGSVFYA